MKKEKKGVIYYLSQILLGVIVVVGGLLFIPFILCTMIVGFIIINHFIPIPEKTEKYNYIILIASVIIGIVFYSYILFYK